MQQSKEGPGSKIARVSAPIGQFLGGIFMACVLKSGEFLEFVWLSISKSNFNKKQHLRHTVV